MHSSETHGEVKTNTKEELKVNYHNIGLWWTNEIKSENRDVETREVKASKRRSLRWRTI